MRHAMTESSALQIAKPKVIFAPISPMILELPVATLTNVPSALTIATLALHVATSPVISPVYASLALPAMVLPAWTLMSAFRAMEVVTRSLNVPIQLARGLVAPVQPAMVVPVRPGATI